MNFLSRPRAKFIVLQAILLASLLAAALQGYLSAMFEGDTAFFTGAVAIFALWALWLVWKRNWLAAEWYAERLIRIGIIGLQIGLLMALGAIASSLMNGADIMQASGLFMGAMSKGLYVSVLALASNVWIEFTIRVVEGD